MTRALKLLVAGALMSATAPAAAEDHFQLGTAALAEGKFEAAIDHFEAHGDREPPHPDVSFNRGLAYLTRVKSGAEHPGDLGRAAAAFAETLAMDPGDEQAEQALEMVHGEVARRRARRGKDAVLAKPTLDRVIVGLAGERAWGIAAITASLLLAIGLMLRRRPAGPLHLAGVLLTPACALLVVVLTPLYLGARHLRLHTESAVLVVREAYLTDASGAALGGEPIPEAAILELARDPAEGRSGRLVHVRYGSAEGWVPLAAVRLLRTR